MSFRLQCQRAEALGQTNMWYCSQAYCEHVQDPERLWRYYIRSGGAADFAVRFDAAMGDLNRWYCSEFHERPVQEPELLWDYYMNWDKLEFGDPKPGESEGGLSLTG